MFQIGADYYPEHWCIDEGEQRWQEDAKLMQKAGFNITRLAEFAWARLEPQEGIYDFAWLDRAVKTLGSHGVKSILCTPTPTMPKWIYNNYPQVIAVDEKGQKALFGNRQINCFTSSVYRSFSKKITRAMAEHYKSDENVTAWQLDNEFWGPNCFCADCENKFRNWLKEKYGTVEELNKEYGTIFWSHTYGSWGEVHLPRHAHSSPSLFLDYKRFHSQNVISFAKEQEEILRSVNPKWIITHNLMGFAASINYYELSKILDVAAFDYYYTMSFADTKLSKLEACKIGAATLDLTRSFKHKNFWIMENNAGAAGWECYGRNLIPGEIKRMTYQNIAHGCDAQVWFRFRTSRYGTEQYWHGLLGHDGKPGRRYNEAKETATELHQLFNEMGETTVKAKAAIVYDYDDRWALDNQGNSKDFTYIDEISKFHSCLSSRGINIDFVSQEDCLKDYKILILCAKYILNKDFAKKVEEFVENGGTLITTYRSGVKNEANVPWAKTLPGFLTKVTGVRVEEYESVPKNAPYTVDFNGKNFKAHTLVDWVIPEKAQVIAGYKDKYMQPYAAITKNNFGKGNCYYIGAVLEEEALEQIIAMAIEESKIQAYCLPIGVEVVTRSGKNDYVFIMNHSEETQRVKIEGTEVISGNKIKEEVVLEPNSVKVIKK